MTDRTCSIDGCERKHDARGWCKSHYMLWYKRGDSLAAKRAAANGDVGEWISGVLAQDSSACIEWPFARSGLGYGRMRWGTRTTFATHVILTQSGSPRPPAPNNKALHSCDNPPCVNPRHLRWGSDADNVADMVERGRAWWTK